MITDSLTTDRDGNALKNVYMVRVKRIFLLLPLLCVLTNSLLAKRRSKGDHRYGLIYKRKGYYKKDRLPKVGSRSFLLSTYYCQSLRFCFHWLLHFLLLFLRLI
jgi:hypothetical protein